MKRWIFLILIGMIVSLATCGENVLHTDKPGLEDFDSPSVPFNGFQPLTTFVGEYATVGVTTNPYPADFHGTYTIAQVRAALTNTVDGAIGPFSIKGIISATGSSSGATVFSTRNFYLQDATGGIYFYIYGHSHSGLQEGSYDITDFGKIMEITVTYGYERYGAVQITDYQTGSVTIRTALSNEPSQIYVRDISQATAEDAGQVVRFGGVISEIEFGSSGDTIKIMGLPQIYCIKGDFNGLDVLDKVTVIGPLTQYYDQLQLDATAGFIGGLVNYVTNAIDN